jgi:hypothetical protein
LAIIATDNAVRVKVYIIDINRGGRFATYRGKVNKSAHLFKSFRSFDNSFIIAYSADKVESIFKPSLFP